jgi:hypothetical protein
MTTREERDSVAGVPRVALTREHAAASLDMSLKHFDRHVRPTIRLLRVGDKVLVPVSELDRWARENSRHTT